MLSCLFLLLLVPLSAAAPITLSGTAPSQRYDGHGGLSAGASSRLLVDYPEPQRSQILDYLFKPQFGASLHMNKVEIGGDTQSTDGTEPSPQHFRGETAGCNVARGYELWLLQEGHKRNPDLQSYLLSWGVPRWIGNGSYFSEDNINYQVSYAQCVRNTLGGSNPHYIGIWNERSWGTVEYVVSLRDALDAAGLSDTKIIVPDGGDCAGVTGAAASNSSYAAAVYALGEHYPCKRACPETAAVGLKFWASEDYSTVADWAGAGCWGRSLSQNWVLLNATSTISWSTIWSVYPTDSYYGNGLMYAFSPWSGNYTVNDPIWTSAHHTQFMTPGWRLLQGGSSGMLPGGGSYVSAISPDAKDFTLILETFEGRCLRCETGTTTAQSLVFSLTNGLPAPGTHLQVWQTVEGATFVQLADAVVGADGTLAVDVPYDGMVTVSTITTATRGSFPPAPPDAPFPLPFVSDFSEAANAYDALPKYFGDQAGSFAVRHGVVQQVTPADPGPNGWGANRDPFSLIGDASWTDITATISVAFNAGTADRGDGAPPEEVAEADVAAAVTTCSGGAVTPAAQQWAFDAIAPGYLSSGPSACLNVPGCDPKQSLIYYACVTTGCDCGCPSFTNLQWALNRATGALSTPLDGECATLLPSGVLSLAPCKRAPGQVWSLNATSKQLSVVPPSGGVPLCLTAAAMPPPPPPPMATYAGVNLRVARYSREWAGVSFLVTDGGEWRVYAGASVVGNGSVPMPFNSSVPHTLTLTAKGSGVTASFAGVQVFSGADTAGNAPNGQVGIMSGYHYAAFSAFSVKAA